VPADSALRKGLAAMSQFFVGDATLEETLQRVSDLANAAVSASDMVGLTMLVDGRARTAVFTDSEASDIDAAQYETGIGPCLDAFRHQQVFRVDDMEKDTRWPQFSEAAAARGIRSSVSIPMVAHHEGVGALNFYSRRSEAFSAEDVKVAVVFGSQAAIVLANSQAYWDAHQLGQNLAEAMRSRATIEQAKGILMAAQRCSPDEAFQILVRASQRENRKLRDMADDIVTRTGGQRSAPVP
jgi:GAF domain-containing protein